MELDGPILDKVRISFPSETDFSQYPFSLEIVKNLNEILFPTQVTFFVGENGTGKSTILEAIATKAGFGREGGSKNIDFETASSHLYSGIKKLSSYMTLSWRKKVRDGYFFRAESFFNLANEIDRIAREDTLHGPEPTYRSYGGKSLHERSHGESFLSFFKNRLGGGGIYIFDEPEASLSPQRQLSLLYIMKELCKNPETQFIIATHSPIILAFPNSTIYSCDGSSLKHIDYQNTSHYEITKNFLENPEKYFNHLFND
jgi:predicted ATPase